MAGDGEVSTATASTTSRLLVPPGLLPAARVPGFAFHQTAAD